LSRKLIAGGFFIDEEGSRVEFTVKRKSKTEEDNAEKESK